MQAVETHTSNRNGYRIGGLCGLAFATLVILQNAVLLAGNPMPNAALADIQEFYQNGSTRIAVAVGIVAVNMALLVVFGSAVTTRLERADGARVAARTAYAGIILLAGAFLTTTLLQAVLVASVDELADANQLQLVWDVHTAAFAMSSIGLGVVLASLSIGSILAGDFVPRWTAYLGLVGALSLTCAGALVVTTLDGGIGIWLQLAGFAVWLVWLLVASVRLLREGPS
jgi:hypothetical protein